MPRILRNLQMPTHRSPQDHSEQETEFREGAKGRSNDVSEQSQTEINSAFREEAVRVIDARFVLEQHLGGGGMGVVYRALDRLMKESDDPDPYVAIKLISDAIKQYPQATLALQREARRSQTLAHPNIVKVFHFGRDGDSYYLTMELLRGESFEKLIHDNPSGLPAAKAIPLVEQLCAGLTYAHEQKIVHSDIKPSNIFLTDSGVVKVLDFGIASPLRAQDGNARETLFDPRKLGAISPRYSSLDMWLGLDADPRDDVYSTACVTYELLTGRHPYGTDKAPQALEKKLQPAPVRSLTRAQNKCLREALSLRRGDRTASIQKFAVGLCSSSSIASTHRAAWWGLGAATAVSLGVWLTIELRSNSQDLRGDGAGTQTTDLYQAAPPVLPTVTNKADVSPSSEPIFPAGSKVSNTAPATPASDRSVICGRTPSSAWVESLVVEGLAQQTELSFATGSDTEQQARAGLLKTRDCLLQLQKRGFTTSRSLQWLGETRELVESTP